MGKNPPVPLSHLDDGHEMGAFMFQLQTILFPMPVFLTVCALINTKSPAGTLRYGCPHAHPLPFSRDTIPLKIPSITATGFFLNFFGFLSI